MEVFQLVVLTSNNCFGYRESFQNGVVLSKNVDTFSQKVQNFVKFDHPILFKFC